MKICLRDNCFTKQAEILKKKIAERIPAVTFSKKETDDTEMKIELFVEPKLGQKESYRIETNECDLQRTIEFQDVWTPSVRITGSDEMGLLFGIGKFLHTAVWEEEAFYHRLGNDGREASVIPKLPQGVVTPDSPVRAIYFALHNDNFYHRASGEELREYLTDLVLYGYNTVFLILPVLNISSPDDMNACAASKSVFDIFSLAKELSVKCGLFVNVNQGFITAPEEFTAEYSYDSVTGVVRGNLGRNLCPNKPGVKSYLRAVWDWEFDQFSDIGLDYIVTWPYDEGGCGCEKCRPWGAKGYLDLVKLCYADAKERFPKCEMIVSTWLFDRVGEPAEYEGLYQRLNEDLSFVSYLMVDDHNDFPKYPLEHPLVKPVINFPEISMWKLWPWGGYGANPLPKRLEGFFKSAEKILSGGAPYSEGNYEDISKIQCIGYYWNKKATYREIFAEYFNYEIGAATKDGMLSPELLEEAILMTELIEKNHVLVGNKELPDRHDALKAGALARKIDESILPNRAQSWRWRVLYIRAILDEKRISYFYDHGMHTEKDVYDLYHISGIYLKEDGEAQALFKELRDIYHSLPLNENNYYTLPPFNGELRVGTNVFV